MNLYEAVRTALEYAAQGELTPEVLAEILGGQPRGAWIVGDEAQVVIAYPGWELDLAEKKGHVVAYIRGVGGPPFVAVRIAEYAGDWRVAFTRMVYAVLEAMEVKA